jgi:hypothetical protein
MACLLMSLSQHPLPPDSDGGDMNDTFSDSNDPVSPSPPHSRLSQSIGRRSPPLPEQEMDSSRPARPVPPRPLRPFNEAAYLANATDFTEEERGEFMSRMWAGHNRRPDEAARVDRSQQYVPDLDMEQDIQEPEKRPEIETSRPPPSPSQVEPTQGALPRETPPPPPPISSGQNMPPSLPSDPSSPDRPRVQIPQTKVGPGHRKLRGLYVPQFPGTWWYHTREDLEALSGNAQRTWSHVGRIMETDLGVHHRSNPCSNCAQQVPPLECWGYNERGLYEVAAASRACARCRWQPLTNGCSHMVVPGGKVDGRKGRKSKPKTTGSHPAPSPILPRPPPPPPPSGSGMVV